MARPLRIGNCSGFFGDRMSALAELAAEPELDVITGDYLAEVTMLVLAKTRAKDPDGGYAASFLSQLRPAVATIAERGIKVVTTPAGSTRTGSPRRCASCSPTPGTRSPWRSSTATT